MNPSRESNALTDQNQLSCAGEVTIRKMVAVALSVGIFLPNQGWSEEARQKDEDVSKQKGE